MSFHSAIFLWARYAHPSIFHWTDENAFAWHVRLQSILKDSWGFSFIPLLFTRYKVLWNYQLDFSCREAIINLGCPKFCGLLSTLRIRKVKAIQRSQVVLFIELLEICIHLHMKRHPEVPWRHHGPRELVYWEFRGICLFHLTHSILSGAWTTLGRCSFISISS